MLTIIRYSYMYYVGIISVNALIAPNAPERYGERKRDNGGTGFHRKGGEMCTH